MQYKSENNIKSDTEIVIVIVVVVFFLKSPTRRKHWLRGISRYCKKGGADKHIAKFLGSAFFIEHSTSDGCFWVSNLLFILTVNYSETATRGAL